MHRGDLYGYQPQVDPAPSSRYPNGRRMEWIITSGFTMPRRHWARPRTLLRAHQDEVRAFCSRAPMDLPEAEEQ
jgi:hypothetical protein